MKKTFFTALLATSLLFTACANGTELPDDTMQNSDVYVDENKYIEGIYLSYNGSPMIIINGTSPCYMYAKDAEITFYDLTDGDRIRIKNTMIRETYPGQVDVYTLEKTADGEYSDIDKSVIESLESLSNLTVDESALPLPREVTVISNEGELDIRTLHVPIESNDVRCYSAAFDGRYQMYFLHGNEVTLHIIDMQEGVIAHTQTLDTDNLPSTVSYSPDEVTVYDFTVRDDGSETVDCAFKISKSGDTFTVTAVQRGAYPVHGFPCVSPDGKYTVYKTTDDGMGHGGIDVRMPDGSVQRVYQNVIFDAHVGGIINDISEVAAYTPVGFVSETAFAHNIQGWEHHGGYGVYDFATDESVYFEDGEFFVHDIYDGKMMVEELGPYYDVRTSQALWSVNTDGSRSLLASQSENSENPDAYVLGEHFYCYFDNGVWLNFKTNIDIGEADVKRIEIRSADFTEVLAEIEYPYGEVIFYLDENLMATENGVTVVFFDVEKIV